MRSDETPMLSAAELRVMLAEAEAREANENQRLREEIDRLRAERPAVALVPTALRVLTVVEAAQMLRVSTATIRNYIKAGKLAAGQNGKGARIMIPYDGVLDMLAPQRLS